jgi:hypothetical protein
MALVLGAAGGVGIATVEVATAVDGGAIQPPLRGESLIKYTKRRLNDSKTMARLRS